MWRTLLLYVVVFVVVVVVQERGRLEVRGDRDGGGRDGGGNDGGGRDGGGRVEERGRRQQVQGRQHHLQPGKSQVSPTGPKTTAALAIWLTNNVATGSGCHFLLVTKY